MQASQTLDDSQGIGKDLKVRNISPREVIKRACFLEEVKDRDGADL